jgi:hypothetical protein
MAVPISKKKMAVGLTNGTYIGPKREHARFVFPSRPVARLQIHSDPLPPRIECHGIIDSSTTTTIQPAAMGEKNQKTWRPHIDVTNLSPVRPRHQPRETHLPGGPSPPTPTPPPLQCQPRAYPRSVPSMVSLLRHYSFSLLSFSNWFEGLLFVESIKFFSREQS